MSEHDERGAPEATPEEAADEEATPRLDLNTATEEELQQLPGIGPALAASIVKYRTEVQPFKEAAEITRVPGISEGLYENLAARLTVSPVEPQAAAAAEEAALPEGEPEAPPEAEAAPEPEAEGEALSEAEAEPEPEAEEALPEAEEEAIAEEPAAAPEPRPPELVEVRTVHDIGWGRTLFVGLLGALLGAALALLVLYVVNGYTLDFRTASERALQAEAYRLQTEVDALDERLGAVEGQMAVLQELKPLVEEARADLEALSRDLSATSVALDNVRQEFTNMREDLDGLTGQVGTLDERLRSAEAQVADMEEQVTALTQAAERFDAFLEGLRQLLTETEQPVKVTPRPMTTVIPLPTPTPTR